MQPFFICNGSVPEEDYPLKAKVMALLVEMGGEEPSPILRVLSIAPWWYSLFWPLQLSGHNGRKSSLACAQLRSPLYPYYLPHQEPGSPAVALFSSKFLSVKK